MGYENRDITAEKVNRLAEIKKSIEALKSEQAELEGFFLKLCMEDLENTKFKTVSYAGDQGRVTATIAESLKLTYPSFLKPILGDAYEDAVTTEIRYKLSAPVTRMLTGLWTNSYTKMTVTDVIGQLPCGDEVKTALGKKLKGAKYDTDKKNLMAIGGFDEQSAEEYAYFVSEAAVWESFLRLLKINKKDADADMGEILNMINGAVVVEETPKITVEAL